VVAWLVEVGQRVEEDCPLVEVMTDKATVQVPSPFSGVVSAIHVPAGSIVAVGTPLVAIETAGGAIAPATRVGASAISAADPGAPPLPATSAASAPGPVVREPEPGATRVPAMPSTRRLARELGVDIDTLRPSGPDGRVTDNDVRAAAGGAAAALSASAAESIARPAAGERRVPLRGVRRRIAEHLTRAAAVPQVTYVDEADFSACDEQRRLAEERAGRRLSYLPFVIRAVCVALREEPSLNARLDEASQEIVELTDIHIGVALDTPEGLLVPTLRHADQLSLLEIADAVGALTDAGRAGRLRPEDLRDSTFTVSSAGRWGGLLATPLLNHPQAAILGVHRVEPRAVVRGGQVVARPVGNLSLTFDHRVVDGVVAARFTTRVIEALQQPDLPSAGSR